MSLLVLCLYAVASVLLYRIRLVGTKYTKHYLRYREHEHKLSIS